MKPLRVKRFIQGQGLGHCAVASSASIANYYNKKINYELAQEITRKHVTDELDDGLYTGHIGILLNLLGFKKVTIISSDTNAYDFSWNSFSKKALIQELANLKRKRSFHQDERDNYAAMYHFLKESRKNKLILDSSFGDHIRSSLYQQKPVIISYNWTLLFQSPKYNAKDVNDYINGDIDYHAVVARGYDERKVMIVDSQYYSYTYKLKKFKKGYYNIGWEEILMALAGSDIVLPDEYDPNYAIEMK